MRSNTVHQYQFVAFFTVFKEPVNSPFLHQALNEIEICFAILHLEVQQGVTGRQPFFKREVIIAQHFINDIDNRLLLKNLIIGGQFRKMKPGTNLNFIHCLITVTAYITSALYNA